MYVYKPTRVKLINLLKTYYTYSIPTQSLAGVVDELFKHFRERLPCCFDKYAREKGFLPSLCLPFIPSRSAPTESCSSCNIFYDNINRAYIENTRGSGRAKKLYGGIRSSISKEKITRMRNAESF